MLAKLSLSTAVRIASRPLHANDAGAGAAKASDEQSDGDGCRLGERAGTCSSVQQRSMKPRLGPALARHLSTSTLRLQVTHPDTYGQVLDCQHPTRITWVSQTMARTRAHSVQIALLKDRILESQIVSGVRDVGAYLWTPPRSARSGTYRDGVWLRGLTESERHFEERVTKQTCLRTVDGLALPSEDMCTFMRPDYAICLRVLSVKDDNGNVTELPRAAFTGIFDENDGYTALSQPFFLIGENVSSGGRDGSGGDRRREACKGEGRSREHNSHHEIVLSVVYPRGSDVKLRAGQVCPTDSL